jgi:hypothetical protein
MVTKQVDITNLKKEIISYMSTGYDGDKKVCIEILNCIDRNILETTSDRDKVLDELDMWLSIIRVRGGYAEVSKMRKKLSELRQQAGES